MKKVLLFSLAVLLMVAPLAVTAQEPGEGGILLEPQSNIANIGSFNPLRCSGVDCQRIFQLGGITVLGLNENGDIAPMADGGLAADWSFNEDGTLMTITLREDVFWSDGEQITAEDVKFSYEAIASGEIESDQSGFIDSIVTGVEVVDDFTVEFSFESEDCTALNVAGFSLVPAHVFGFDGNFEGFDYSVMIDHPFDTEPNVSAGPFVWSSTTDQQINMVANQNYSFADGVLPTGYAAVDVPDFTVGLDRFLAGELNIMLDQVEIARMQEVRDSDNQWIDFPANSYTYLGLNTANPDNPQDALDADGNIIEQDPHPIFGDVRVRQALTYAIDRVTVVSEVLNGEGVVPFSFEIPTSWAVHPDLEVYPYDVELADQLLTEAGWVDGDGDGVREATADALYAEEGTPLSFELITNDSNPQRVDIGTVVQDQLGDLGVEVDFQPIDFNAAVDALLAQTFDAVILGWSLSYPANPDQTQIFGAAADTVGSGFNFTSWVNEDFIELNEQARTLPGCDQGERAEIYHEMQEIIYEEAPYIFLYAPNDMYAVSPALEGWSSLPNQEFYGVEDWAFSQ